MTAEEKQDDVTQQIVSPEEILGLKEPEDKNNPDDAYENQESLQEENGSDKSLTVISYDRLKAKSDNPVTGIDLKKREVCFVFICFLS